MFHKIFNSIKNNRIKLIVLTTSSVFTYSNRKIIFNKTEKINGRILNKSIELENEIDSNRPYISLITATPPGKTFRDFMANPFGHSSIGINLSKPINIKEQFGNIKVYSNEIESKNFIFNVTPIHQNESGIKNPIHIITKNKYLYESDINQNDQGGIYNRTFFEIRFYVPDEKIFKLISYFIDLYNKMESNESQFSLYGHLKVYKSYIEREKQGNCAYWISKGLEHVEIIQSHSYYPGVLFLKVLQCIQTDSTIIKYESSIYNESIAGDGFILTPFVPIFIKLSNKENKLIDYTIKPKCIYRYTFDFDLYELEIEKH